MSASAERSREIYRQLREAAEALEHGTREEVAYSLTALAGQLDLHSGREHLIRPMIAKLAVRLVELRGG